MSFLILIIVVGLGVALLVVAGMAIYERRRRIVGDAGMPKLPGQHSIAQLGLNEPARMSLNTVIMRPTKGLRFLSLGFSAFSLWMIWGPIANSNSHDTLLAIGASTLISYVALFIANYEARYDDEGLTAPDWFFVERRFDWADFEGMGEDGNLLYKLYFDGKRKVHLQKYLVGMPTFLTFVEDVKALNRRT